MVNEIKISSSAQMKKIAKIFSLSVFKSGFDLKDALVLALAGDLGAGKTAFVQGFMKGAGIGKKITSPTFTIIKSYELRIKNRGNYKRIYHVDLYRAKKAKEIFDLGLKEILKNPRNIVLIEWPERIKKYLPKNAIRIKFKHGEKENERILNL